MFNQDIVIGRRLVPIQKLKYYVLPGKFGNLANHTVFSKMFDFWKQQWEPLVRSLSKKSQLDSDEFLRQFEITALVYEDDVVGLLGLDLFDLDNPVHLEHSYFSWLAAENHSVFKNFGLSLVINQLAVSKLWRGEYGIADLLVGLATKRMESGAFQRTICYTRNYRRTDSLAERWGARAILKGQMVHSEPSTYYEFPRDCLMLSNHTLKPVVEILWQEALNKNHMILNAVNINTKKGEIYEANAQL